MSSLPSLPLAITSIGFKCQNAFIRSGVVHVPHVIKCNIRPLRHRCTGRNPNRHIRQILIRTWQHRQFQRLVLRPLQHIRQADRRHLLTLDVESRHCDGAALGETLDCAGIRTDAEVEAFEDKSLDARAALELGEGVEVELAKSKQIDWGGGIDVLEFGVGHNTGSAFDRTMGNQSSLLWKQAVGSDGSSRRIHMHSPFAHLSLGMLLE